MNSVLRAINLNNTVFISAFNYEMKNMTEQLTSSLIGGAWIHMDSLAVGTILVLGDQPPASCL